MLRKFIFAFCLVIFTKVGYASDKFIFSGGAPLSSYQPATIIPLLTEAFKRNGLKFEAIHFPSRRSLAMSNSGQVDGELHRVHNFHKVSGNQYPNLMRIDSKLMDIALAVFSLSPAIAENIDKLDNLSIAYQAGRMDVKKILQDRYPDEMITTVASDGQAFLMLSRGRVDVVISESFYADCIIKMNPEMAEVKRVFIIQETPVYAYIHKKHQALSAKIATSLDSMKADGSFDRISRKAYDKIQAELHNLK